MIRGTLCGSPEGSHPRQPRPLSAVKSTAFPIALLAVATLLALGHSDPAPAAPKGGPRPSPSRSLIGPQGVLAENQYRPRVRFTAGKASGSRLPLVATFSTMRGFVDRIEVRIDGKVVDTLRPGKPLRSGQLEAVVDLSRVGPGSHKLTLWAWQGREGHQRFHGESKALKFDR